MVHTHSDAYYSTMDSIIAVIDRKMPKEAQDADTLERLLDDVLMHFKMKELQNQ